MDTNEFRVLAKHCFLTGKNTAQARDWLHKCYGDSAPEKPTIIDWYAEFKRDQTGNENVDQSGQPIEGDNETLNQTETIAKNNTSTVNNDSDTTDEFPPAKNPKKTTRTRKDRGSTGGKSSGKGRRKSKATV